MNPTGQALRVARRFSSRARTEAAVAGHQGGWRPKRAGDSPATSGRRDTKPGTPCSDAAAPSHEDGRALGAEAVRRWNAGGGGGASTHGGDTRRTKAPTPATSARCYGASKGGHIGGAGLLHRHRSPPEVARSGGQGESGAGRDGAARQGWLEDFGKNAARHADARRNSSSSRRGTDGGFDRTTMPSRTLAAEAAAEATADAAAATTNSSLRLEQASIMRKLKQAKTRRNGDEAKRVLEDALAQEDAAELVDVFVFSAAVGAFAKAGRWEDALGVLGTMRERGVRPNEFTYNQAISACGNGGAWNWAVYLLKAMPKVGLAPDVVSYNAAIGACARAGQFEIGVVLLREMTTGSSSEEEEEEEEEEGTGRRRRPAPNELTYNTVLSALPGGGGGAAAAGAAASYWKLAVGLLDEMREKRIAAGAESYALVVAACVAGDQAGTAVRLLRQMRGEDRITPALETYNAAMTACRKAGEWGLAVVLLAEVKEADGVAADSTTYAEAVEACRRGGRSDLAADLLRESQEARRAGVVGGLDG